MFVFGVKLLFLICVGLIEGQQFICNNYRNSAACEGSQASDGICGWGLFGCTAVAPLPSPTVQVVTAPPIVCPAYTAQASCVYDPC